MRAGLLRHPITIEGVEWVQDPKSGAVTEQWVEFAKVWAEVRELRGREFWAAQQVQSEVTTRVLIRHIEGVTPEMRVQHGDRVLEIDHIIDPDGRGRELQLMCKEAPAS